MTEVPGTAPGADPTGVPHLTDAQLDELASLFDMARAGDDRLLAYLDAGVPVNLTNSRGDTLLILATYHQHAGLVAELIARGADTERENDRGQTALGCATFRQDLACIHLLLDAGADPDGGTQSARSIVDFFGLDAVREVLDNGS